MDNKELDFILQEGEEQFIEFKESFDSKNLAKNLMLPESKIRYIYILGDILLSHMIQKYNRYKILEVFFDYPTKEFHLRELVRLTGITMPSMINHINELVKEELILKEKKGIYPAYKANIESKKYKIYKIQNVVLRLNNSGFLDYIYDLCIPDTIILFGSSSRGEDTEKSDIDLFVQSKEKKIDLGKYEKILKRKINLYFESDFNTLPNELKNNILNGQIVRGYLKVF